MTERETMAYDVVIVGAGPSGLSAAIRLKQLHPEAQICIVEKGSEVGAHILSGAVLEPRALMELLPDWKERGAPLYTPAADEHFLFLTSQKSIPLPLPPYMNNHGNYIISLGNFCRWLATQAEQLGVHIFPGYAAKEVFFEDGRIAGIITSDRGISKQHTKKPDYQPGVLLKASFTLFAEGCRGSLAEPLIQKYNLRKNADPQTYAIGIKELWEVSPTQHHQGRITHTVGWPLYRNAYGGSFLYHLENNQVAIGFVTGLDYTNPYLSPYEEFQRFKLHPAIRPILEGGKRLSYGARALNEGGFQSIPELVMPGGAIIGCSAGFLNVPKIKGTHTAMKSGMLAAEAVAEALKNNSGDISAYAVKFKKSWIYKELKAVRNIRPAFRWGLLTGMLYTALELYFLKGKLPWTLHHHTDHTQLKKAKQSTPLSYPPPDGRITFDKLTSVQLSNTNHEEDQPSHLKIKEASLPVTVNLEMYDGPEQRYCPAAVYEFLKNDRGESYLHINAQNCIHCKTCDIKDPMQNIVWVPPEGGGGPRYPNM